MTKITPAQQAILDRLKAGEVLYAYADGSDKPCRPFWAWSAQTNHLPSRPSSSAMVSLYRAGTLRWKARPRPFGAIQRAGELVLTTPEDAT